MNNINNEYFENIEKAGLAYTDRYTAHYNKKEDIINKYGWDSKEMDEWYNEEEEIKKDAFPAGVVKAFNSWKRRNAYDGAIVCEEIWRGEVLDYMRTLFDGGITEIIITDKSTALMENLHEFCSYGWKMDSCITITKDYGTIVEKEEVKGIRLVLTE